MVAAVVILGEARNLPEEGAFAGNFLAVVDSVFAGGFGENGWLDVVFLW